MQYLTLPFSELKKKKTRKVIVFHANKLQISQAYILKCNKNKLFQTIKCFEYNII